MANTQRFGRLPRRLVWLLLAAGSVLVAAAAVQAWREVSRHEDEAAAQRFDEAVGATVEAIEPDLAADLGLPPDSIGLVVTSLADGQAAEKAGLRPGDVIEQIGPYAVTNAQAAADALAADRGARLDLTVNRHGRDLHLVIPRRTATGHWLLLLGLPKEISR